jgi:hypothetical protein
MAATFDPALSDDISKVRFHIGDTDVNAPKLADETITALLSLGGSVGGAVIMALKHLIAQMSEPNFTADWLTVSSSAALPGLMKLLTEKRREFGVSAVTSASIKITRSDI